MTKGTSVLMQRTKQAYRYGQLARRGMNIYALFTPLRDALRKTSLGDVRIGDLRMPFDVLYIGFEEGSGITFGTRTHPRALVVDGAYVTAAPVDPETGKQHIDVCITTRDALSALRAGYGAHWPFSYEPHFTFTLKGRPDDTFEAALGEALDTNAVDLDVDEDGLHSFRQAVVEYQDEAAASGIQINTPAVSVSEELAAFKSRNLSEAKKALSLILGALCALTARPNEADLPETWPEGTPEVLVAKVATARSPKKRRDAENELKKRGFVSVRRLDLDAFGGGAHTSGDGAGGSVAPHWRACHFRRQPVGKDQSERRLIWILPTIVNASKGAPNTGRLYKVKGTPPTSD
ncbi:hypothetical protein [Marinobacter sp.]|uniref:hypothetical protein n=1 Tax=Marinobacter sp. TaxID=50741 RepID=UPI002B4A1C55|nr:hypothetical protein [Marinobacter sp.]HKK57809.1 hypothetical protein [Marinobacter sp.]